MTAPDASGQAKTWSSVDWYSVPRPAEPPGPAPRSRRRRLVTVLAVAWVLVLVGTGVWYSFHGSATVREQTTVAQAQPRVDEAVGKVLVAAGTGPVPAISGYEKTDNCRVTPVRTGARYERLVRLYTPVGGEVELLRRIAGGLPGGYRAKLRGDSLFADAGYYVAVTGGVERPGVVRVVASTGCRPLGHRPASDPTGKPPADERVTIDPVLAALGTGTVRWSTHVLPCGVRTVEAAARARPASLRTVMHPANAVLRSDDAVAYRDGGTAVAARRDGGVLTVSATTGSCA